jgi:ComF family protein
MKTGSVESGRGAVNLARAFAVDELARRALAWLLPPRCLLCGGPGDDGRGICGDCRRELPRNEPCCPRCGLALSTPAPLCGRCLKRAPAFAAAFVPYRYAFPLDRLVSRFKFGSDLAAGTLLSELLVDALVPLGPRCDLLVPMPLSPRRMVERGYNQALELARPLARGLRLVLDPKALVRVRDTCAQTGLDRKERRRNVKGAFRAGDIVRGRRVALLDDVVTTGATAEAAARALLRAGATEVLLWAVARD